ncbi:hypothetical protein M431DRAFT_513190 [Trichoderma harzianum CBS 226.95]|uniref:Uncharacterized protein n=1 Tax=Trichoderma harzianum CBS 226.95 TaxID=983964 RepID=A0A2T3ZWG9_TRIHA|nr:hypothetical protein M431DRAFT_513190 [Trichoderma harzianum CBS 226.95]PTB49157.1 hypothetical protein M431DRAFT_513190 [Trichoderma harzianum CBS 226.95]
MCQPASNINITSATTRLQSNQLSIQSGFSHLYKPPTNTNIPVNFISSHLISSTIHPIHPNAHPI